MLLGDVASIVHLRGRFADLARYDVATRSTPVDHGEHLPDASGPALRSRLRLYALPSCYYRSPLARPPTRRPVHGYTDILAPHFLAATVSRRSTTVAGPGHGQYRQSQLAGRSFLAPNWSNTS